MKGNYDIDDAVDDIIWQKDSSGTSWTPAHEHAGNMIQNLGRVRRRDGRNQKVRVHEHT